MEDMKTLTMEFGFNKNSMDTIEYLSRGKNDPNVD